MQRYPQMYFFICLTPILPCFPLIKNRNFRKQKKKLYFVPKIWCFISKYFRKKRGLFSPRKRFISFPPLPKNGISEITKKVISDIPFFGCLPLKISIGRRPNFAPMPKTQYNNKLLPSSYAFVLALIEWLYMKPYISNPVLVLVLRWHRT